MQSNTSVLPAGEQIRLNGARYMCGTFLFSLACSSSLKGPQGPKTLCNACGLRWAKEVRSKVDENAAAGTSSAANKA